MPVQAVFVQKNKALFGSPFCRSFRSACSLAVRIPCMIQRENPSLPLLPLPCLLTWRPNPAQPSQRINFINYHPFSIPNLPLPLPPIPHHPSPQHSNNNNNNILTQLNSLPAPPPAQQAQRRARRKGREGEPDEGGVGLGLAAAVAAVDVGADLVVVVDAAVYDDVVGGVVGRGAGVDAEFGGVGLCVWEKC